MKRVIHVMVIPGKFVLVSQEAFDLTQRSRSHAMRHLPLSIENMQVVIHSDFPVVQAVMNNADVAFTLDEWREKLAKMVWGPGVAKPPAQMTSRESK